MLKLDLYIHGCGSIAPAAGMPDMPVEKLLASEPDYTGFIPPMQLRRMSKVVRMGIGAAKACMQDAGIEKPDALSLGTAMGCLQDTELFLSKMVAQDEKMLTPTAFIQSTHNTVGGQIALLAGCHGHNMTYVHSGHSLEHALLNARLYLTDHPGHTVLAGGIDELTDTSHRLMQRAGVYNADALAPVSVPDRHNGGTLAGEGAVFFTISGSAEGAILKLSQLSIFRAGNAEEAYEKINAVRSGLPPADLVLLGQNGDANNTGFYDRLQQEHFSDVQVLLFKRYCGEYATAGAYGLSLIAKTMQGRLPEALTKLAVQLPVKRAIMINHYCGHYSCWLTEAV